MEELSYIEIQTRLSWAMLQVSQVKAECESWRNKALLLQMKAAKLEAENLELRQKLAHSLPLYDPDEFIAAKE